MRLTNLNWMMLEETAKMCWGKAGHALLSVLSGLVHSRVGAAVR